MHDEAAAAGVGDPAAHRRKVADHRTAALADRDAAQDDLAKEAEEDI